MQYWSWILAAIGVTGIFFVGRKAIWGWLLLLFNECLWIVYAVTTKQYGFIFAKEDVDKKISQNVRGVPSFQYFYNGEMVDTSTGADINDVKEKVEKLVATLNQERSRS